MLLMIDNYDSFTYNLVQYFAELGAEVEVQRNDKLTINDIETLNPQQIVISPGPCTPNEAGVSLEVIEHFAGKKTDFGGMSGTSGDWSGFWWQCRTCPRNHAWQNLSGFS